MLPAVFQLLKASTAVKAIVGTNPPRIYRHGDAPQDTTKPYVTWQLIGDAPENHLSGTPPTDRASPQVDCWHQTDKGVEDLATAVRDALEGDGYMTGIVVNLREPETKLYRIGMQFDFFVDR